LAVDGAEGPDEVLARVAGPGRQRRDVDLLGVVAVDPVPGPPQHPQRGNVGLLHRLSPRVLARSNECTGGSEDHPPNREASGRAVPSTRMPCIELPRQGQLWPTM